MLQGEAQSHQFVVAPGGGLGGELRVASDKSISHRAVLLGGLCEGTSRVDDLLLGEDVRRTVGAMRALGVDMDPMVGSRLTIRGRGPQSLSAPPGDLDMGNSGTGMRLLAGLLAAQPFPSRLTGDESLSGRPMGRIIDPLTRMGASIDAKGQRPPLAIHPGGPLRSIDYHSPVASAQVKSCLLLAGLCADVEVTVHEPAVSRDHTERMLLAMGARLTRGEGWVRIEPGSRLRACDQQVPADISSAAFFLVAASIAKDADLLLKDVCVNPTRTGVLDILDAMGGRIERLNVRTVAGEPVADLRVTSTELRGIDIPPEWVPRSIDEFPAVFVAAACASGTTRIRGARELRVKESDRIAVMASALADLGARVREYDDGVDITGGSLAGGTVDSAGDHRCAMSLSVAALRCSHPVVVLNTRNVATSYPDFSTDARRAGFDLREGHP